MNGIFRVGFFVAGRPLSRVEGLSTRTHKFPGHTHVMFFGGRFRASKAA